ncbi:universal stress protein [Amycolatopsis sp. NPDC049253]|uniref:universal stress protein n=1 Tax=Amycolatopsis sp. NPDC049253 TaxID=3155274 RepID=UPI00341B51D5
MTSSDSGSVVVGVDGSVSAIDAVRWAARSAARHGAALELLHATSFPDLLAFGVVPATDEAKDFLRHHGRHLLRAARETALGAGVTEVRERLDPDRPAQALLGLAGPDTVLVVGHGRGRVGSVLAGSVASALITHAPCRVVVVRGDEWDAPATTAPVVAGVDGGPGSAAVTEAAFAEADTLAAPLLVLHAAAGDGAEPRLDELLAEPARRHPGVHVEHETVARRPRHELLARSAEARLVVVGRRGRGGFPGLLLGSTTHAVLQHGTCPMLMVPTTG